MWMRYCILPNEHCRITLPVHVHKSLRDNAIVKNIYFTDVSLGNDTKKTRVAYYYILFGDAYIGLASFADMASPRKARATGH